MRISFLLEVLVFVDLPKSAETNSLNHQVKIYYIVLDFWDNYYYEFQLAHRSSPILLGDSPSC